MRSVSFASGNEIGMIVIDQNNSLKAMELSGEELDEYCRNRGLCKRCAKVVTHKRVVKLFGKDVKWEPLTIKKEGDEVAPDPVFTDARDIDATFNSHNSEKKNIENEYSVYKGYCLKEHTCYTLAEAKRLLGEGSPNGKDARRSNRFRFSVSKSVLKRPGKRRMRTNPETGSVAGSIQSYSSSPSGNSSQASSSTRKSFLSGLSNFSGLSGFSSKSSRSNRSGSRKSVGSFGNRFRGGNSSGHRKSRKGPIKQSSASSWSFPSLMRHDSKSGASSFDNSEVTIEDMDVSARTTPVSTSTYSSDVSPIVAHRVEQLVSYDHFVVLYLSGADLSSATGTGNIDAIVDALRRTKTLESITFERCSLDDEGMEKLAGGLEAGGHIHNYNSNLKQKMEPEIKNGAQGETRTSLEEENKARTGVLKTLRLQGNRIGNRGVQALEFLFRSSSTLEEIDLSDNCIGSKGATSILESLAQNAVGIPLSVLNLSQNEIWSLCGDVNQQEDASSRSMRTATSSMSMHHVSFLHTNSTLLELNLDGNCLHDEGAEYIAEALSINRQRGVLRKLQLGWNGIGDNGAIALAKALEWNKTIKVLGLAENDITNIGARGLLSALAVNVSMKEISGLYHNRIDRKFIIVAIKRLLHRKVQEEQRRSGEFLVDESAHMSEASLIIEQVVSAEETEEESSMSSSSSYAEESSPPVAVVSREQQQKQGEHLQHQQPKSSKFLSSWNSSITMSQNSSSSIALEAIENWDWGTFGIEEIERRKSENTELQINEFLKDIEEELSEDGDNPLTNEISTDNDVPSGIGYDMFVKAKKEKPSQTDRIVVFQAAPLAYFDRKTMQHHGVPLLDFAHEAKAIEEIFSSSNKSVCSDEESGTVEVVFETATQANIHNFFAKSLSPVMHFSCYGNADFIALENGFGYMQALPLDAMKKLVASEASESNLQVVVVSSCHADHLAEAFLTAGVPNVVALPRDPTTFRDQGPIDFARGFYGALRQSKNLRDAFVAGIRECTNATSPPALLDSYKLLPEGGNHRLKIFFQNPPPPMIKPSVPTDIIGDEDPMAILPKIPDQFYGREVDMYEILESLRVDDVIRIGGVPGCGKTSVLSVLSRYILERSKSFQIDSVFWLPPPSGMILELDSIYGDLCLVLQWIIGADDDIWDDEGYKDARERILIEMEGRNSILVIDGRVFTNEIAGEMLERFLSLLLNEVNVKVILITAGDASRAKTKRSASEETTIYLGPLDFQSTVKLYGNACPLITSSDDNGCFCGIDTVNEFESFLLPGSLAKSEDRTADLVDADSKKPNRSHRQKELYDAMGRGIPREIMRRATSCTTESLSDLLKIAQRPGVSIATSNELKELRKRWIAERDYAIESKYYLRASDIEKTIGELEDLRKVYPSLDDMKAKEVELKKTFSALLKAKRYDEANFVKRKILSLKRTMMKEKYSLSTSRDSYKTDALDSINEIQERMKTMLALASSMDSSAGSFALEEVHQTSFVISERCTLEISSARLESFWKESSSSSNNSAMVVWTNEACELSGYDVTMQQVLENVAGDELSSMVDITTTEWGSVKCATGDSVLANSVDGCIVLSVPPLPLKTYSSLCGKTQESLQYMQSRLRSAIRSSFRKIERNKNASVEGKGMDTVVGISTTTALHDNAYPGNDDDVEEHRRRNLAVTLNTIVAELRRANDGESPNSKTTVRLFASSGYAESLELVKIASDSGLAKIEKHA